MNWDKVRREKPMIEHYDYSAMMDARERGVSLDGGDVGERMAERRERLGIGAQRHPDGPLPHRQPNAPRQRAVPVRGGEHETVIPPSDVRDSCGDRKSTRLNSSH